MDSNLINNNSSLNIDEKEKIYNNVKNSIYKLVINFINNNVKNSICKIVINDNKENYGFFCNILNRENSDIIPVLITNYTTLSLENIKTNVKLKLLLNEGKEEKNISLQEFITLMKI